MDYVIRERGSDEVIANGVEGVSMVIVEGNWYFAPEQVNMKHLRLTDRTYTCPYKGVCYWFDLETPHEIVRNVAWVYQNPKRGYEAITNRIGFYSEDTAATLAFKPVLQQHG
jgi:uncharacterized protein (DUF427 family)